MNSQKQKNEVFNELYQSYNREIIYLRKEGSKLLEKIKLQEIKMNKRKQKHLKPLLRQVNLLHRMMKKLIKISAFIDTYKYFQMIKEPLTYYNQKSFYQMASMYYEDALKEIVLKIKRINQLQIDNSVDFTIIEEKSYLS